MTRSDASPYADQKIIAPPKPHFFWKIRKFSQKKIPKKSFQRRKMKNCKSSETCFAEVSRRSELCSGGKPRAVMKRASIVRAPPCHNCSGPGPKQLRVLEYVRAYVRTYARTYSKTLNCFGPGPEQLWHGGARTIEARFITARGLPPEQSSDRRETSAKHVSDDLQFFIFRRWKLFFGIFFCENFRIFQKKWGFGGAMIFWSA